MSEKPENISVPHAAARAVATAHTSHTSSVVRRSTIVLRAIDIRQRIQRINLTHRWSRSTITHTAVTSYSSLTERDALSKVVARLRIGSPQQPLLDHAGIRRAREGDGPRDGRRRRRRRRRDIAIGWISSCADSEKTCLSLAISRRDIRTVHTYSMPHAPRSTCLLPHPRPHILRLYAPLRSCIASHRMLSMSTHMDMSSGQCRSRSLCMSEPCMPHMAMAI